MPAIHYTVRWPDARETVCYSPSLIVQELLPQDRALPLPEFMRRVREATAIANERVQAKYGFVCSRANDQLAVLENLSRAFAGQPDALVQVTGFSAAD
ncbi:MSMEG_0570 family nitrogen starvation response protein [Ideonella sp. YS5]|uniref:MSMEG_0570 family nitrogen starvation response protein n=1 Tax=Ideonella sp. YS5 TaxID=3453714 RepID=UPI003EEBB274